MGVGGSGFGEVYSEGKERERVIRGRKFRREEKGEGYSGKFIQRERDGRRLFEEVDSEGREGRGLFGEGDSEGEETIFSFP